MSTKNSLKIRKNYQKIHDFRLVLTDLVIRDIKVIQKSNPTSFFWKKENYFRNFLKILRHDLLQ